MSIDNLPVLLDARPVPQDERAALQFTETLPLALVSLLERRFLAPFQGSNWQIHSQEGDTARPLLREVLSLGRPHRPEEWIQAMPHVLTACHDPGHSLMMALYGQGDRHRLYLGGRRVIGAGARSTEDYLLAQESAFKSYFSGLRMGPVRRLDTEEQPDLAGFLQTAPALGVVTGIPSRRDAKGGPLQFQSLDRLVNAVGEQRYALFVVAEPLDPWAIDTTLDASGARSTVTSAGLSTGASPAVRRTESSRRKIRASSRSFRTTCTAWRSSPTWRVRSRAWAQAW
jgi:hypothetical protein